MATKTRRLCPRCGKLVMGRCPVCDKARHRIYGSDRKDKDDIKFYNTKAWLKCRKTVLYRDRGLCSCGNNATLVHHIKPIKEYPELKTDVSNCRSLCESCHQKVHKAMDNNDYEKIKKINTYANEELPLIG